MVREILLLQQKKFILQIFTQYSWPMGNSMSNQQAKCICILDFHETWQTRTQYEVIASYLFWVCESVWLRSYCPFNFSAFWTPSTTFFAVTFLQQGFMRYFACHLVQHEILFHMTQLKGVVVEKGQRSIMVTSSLTLIKNGYMDIFDTTPF